jgi:hypothetical protein
MPLRQDLAYLVLRYIKDEMDRESNAVASYAQKNARLEEEYHNVEMLATMEMRKPDGGDVDTLVGIRATGEQIIEYQVEFARTWQIRVARLEQWTETHNTLLMAIQDDQAMYLQKNSRTADISAESI